MDHFAWIKEFAGAITVCDTKGIIVEMNAKAATMFEEMGGIKLLGTNLYDCHPEPARTKLKNIMENQEENVYTIEKNGKRKLIYQSPWYVDGQCQGFVEIVLPLPPAIPHFIRDGV
jgi:transcriptional regulator with PAS, ATPase and Fis domain